VNCTGLKNFSQFTIFEQLALALKKSVALKIFTVVNILFTFSIFNNFRLPWKQSFPWNFSLYWIYFLLFRIFEQRRLPWKKTELSRNFHCIEYAFYIQEFWATCVCPVKQRVPWFHCTEYIFYYSGFWAACACPEKQRCPESSLYGIYFSDSEFGHRVALEFFTVLNTYFSSLRIFEQLAIALKITDLHRKFSLFWNIFYRSGFLSN